MKSKLKAAWTALWAKVKPWIQSKSKAIAALFGGLASLYAGTFLSIWLFNATVDWSSVNTTAITMLFGAFGLTYFAPANKPLD